jgi:FAD/FMN-containing dehydrogenase
MTVLAHRNPPPVSEGFVVELRNRAARSLPVRPLTAREVSIAVRYARDEGQEIELDLSGMKRVVVVPANRTARVQPGVTVAELERAAFQWGLQARMNAEGLVGARVVLPDGELVDADPELLARIRAGAGEGIVVEAIVLLGPVNER